METITVLSIRMLAHVTGPYSMPLNVPSGSMRSQLAA